MACQNAHTEILKTGLPTFDTDPYPAANSASLKECGPPLRDSSLHRNHRL